MPTTGLRARLDAIGIEVMAEATGQPGRGRYHRGRVGGVDVVEADDGVVVRDAASLHLGDLARCAPLASSLRRGDFAQPTWTAPVTSCHMLLPLSKAMS
jgi:hypothetical protein